MQIPAKAAKKFIEKIMEEEYVSIREIARRTSVSDATMYKIVNLERNVVYPSTIRQIRQAFPNYELKMVDDEWIADKTVLRSPQEQYEKDDIEQETLENLLELKDAIQNNDLRRAIHYILKIQSKEV